MKDKIFNMAKNYLTGRLKCAEFAITNVCLAQCTFCNIWKQKPKVFVDTSKALAAIDRMAALGVSHITLTGGEPLMHPDIVALVERASARKVHTGVLNAAPKLLLKEGLLEGLSHAGADLISISFDSGDPQIMAESRKIDGIMEDMSNAMSLIKRTGIKTMASVLIWNDNYNDLESVCEKAVHMGFDFISLNYPTFSDSEVYELGGSGISLPKEDIISGLELAVRLKKMKKYPIINSVVSMENIIRYMKDPSTVKYLCLGGRRVLFVDWFLEVHPCMQLSETLGHILTMKESDFDRPDCNACNMSWYRDFSLILNGVRSVPLLFEMLKESGGII